MVRKTIVSIVFIAVFAYISVFSGLKTADAVDCLTITSHSSQADKDFCRNELAQIEAELANLINKQKEQQKQTGTLKGDINYLSSQIKALQTKVKARSLKITQLKVDISNK